MSVSYGKNGVESGSPIYGEGGIRSGSEIYGRSGSGLGSPVIGVGLSSIPFKMSESSIINITGELGTFARATSATVEDHEGVIRETLSGEVRFQGQRRIENLLDDAEDFSTASWVKTGTASVTGVNTLNFPAVSDLIKQTLTVNTTDNQSHVLRLELSGVGTITLQIYNFISSITTQITLSNTPQIFSINKTWADDNTLIRVSISRQSGDTATFVTANYAQFQNKTGASDPSAPDGYVSTGVLSSPYHGANVDGVKYFATDNGNSVASNIVTEANGSTITNGANWRVGFGTGDSFADGSTEWLRKMLITSPYSGYFTGIGRGGQLLTGLIGNNFELDIKQTPLAGFASVQGGWNDLATQTSTAMLDAVKAMYATATTENRNFTVINISPSRNAATWTSGKQTILESYNSALATWASANSIPVADIYTALGDATNTDELAAAYDSGDGLHPNEAGSQLIADTLIAAIAPFRAADIGEYRHLPPSGNFLTDAFTNKCTCYNANPDSGALAMGSVASFNAAVTNIVVADAGAGALFGVVDDASELADFGLDNYCSDNLTYKIDNTSGSGVATLTPEGTTGNTNAHTLSMWARVESGGSAGLAFSGGSDLATVISPKYEKVIASNQTPADTTRKLEFTVPAGSVAYVILMQLEEKAFTASEIVVAGSSVTTNADSLKYPSTNIPVNDLAIKVKWTAVAASQGTVDIFSWGAGANYIDLQVTATQFVLRKVIAGVTYQAVVSDVYYKDVPAIVKIRVSSVSGVDIWLDDVKGIGASNAGDITASGDITLGAKGGIFIQSGSIEDFTVHKGSFTDAEIIAL